MKLLSHSKPALILCCCILIYEGVFYYPKWKQSGTEATLSWDVSGYYMYLPAIFIYHDIKKCRFKDSILHKYSPTPDFQQAFQHRSGNYVMKYSCGQAILLSPFFVMGHFIAKFSGDYAADGFSFPYQMSVGIGALFYCFLGLLLLRKVLLNFFSDSIVAITLLTIVFASNYLEYSAIDCAMTHNTLFTIYSALLYFTIEFYNKPGWSKAVVAGSLIGLATLIRPTEIISGLILFFWGLKNAGDIRQRIIFFRGNPKYILAVTLPMILIIFIQCIYWKTVSGEWVVYSYPGQGFSWLKPHLKDFLFSYRSGWLVYSPAMLFAIAGFMPLYRKYKNLFIACSLFSVLFIYIASAWDIWWYGGSLGQRTMVQACPILCFPLAAFWQWVSSTKIFFKTVTTILLAFFIWFNLWLTRQSHRGGLIAPGEMTAAYFWAVFGKNHVDERTISLLDNNDFYTGKPGIADIVYSNDFKSDTSQNNIVYQNEKCISLNQINQFSAEYFFELSQSGNKWLRASADFLTPDKEWNTWKMPQFIVRFYFQGRMIKMNQIRVCRLLSTGQKKNVILDAKIPDQKIDRVSVLFWNAGSDKEIFIDNLNVIAFN